MQEQLPKILQGGDPLKALCDILTPAHKGDVLDEALNLITRSYVHAVRDQYHARRGFSAMLFVRMPKDASRLQLHDYIIDAQFAMEPVLHKLGSLEDLPDPGDPRIWDHSGFHRRAFANWRIQFEYSVARFRPIYPIMGRTDNAFDEVSMHNPMWVAEIAQAHYYGALTTWSMHEFNQRYPPGKGEL